MKPKFRSYQIVYNGKIIKRGLRTNSHIKQALLQCLLERPRQLAQHSNLLSLLQSDKPVKFSGSYGAFTITGGGNYTIEDVPNTAEDEMILHKVGTFKNSIRASGANLPNKLPALIGRDTKYSPDGYESDSNVRLQISAERSKGKNLILKPITHNSIIDIECIYIPKPQDNLKAYTLLTRLGFMYRNAKFRPDGSSPLRRQLIYDNMTKDILNELDELGSFYHIHNIDKPQSAAQYKGATGIYQSPSDVAIFSNGRKHLNPIDDLPEYLQLLANRKEYELLIKFLENDCNGISELTKRFRSLTNLSARKSRAMIRQYLYD